MEQNTFLVSLSVEEAAEKIHSAVVDGSITGELLDHYVVQGRGDEYCVVAVYEKHYWRAGNRLTLTVTIDNLSGPTRVHCIGGGGGEGLFRFDWGAASSFSSLVYDCLRDDLL